MKYPQYLFKGIPDVLLEKCEEKEDGSRWYKVTTKSIPSPCFVQWTMAEKNNNSFEVIDVSVEDYKGTSNSLPHPVLVINHSKQLQTHLFQIEVRNFIGSCKKIIPGISLNVFYFLTKHIQEFISGRFFYYQIQLFFSGNK